MGEDKSTTILRVLRGEKDGDNGGRQSDTRDAARVAAGRLLFNEADRSDTQVLTSCLDLVKAAMTARVLTGWDTVWIAELQQVLAAETSRRVMEAAVWSHTAAYVGDLAELLATRQKQSPAKNKR